MSRSSPVEQQVKMQTALEKASEHLLDNIGFSSPSNNIVERWNAYKRKKKADGGLSHQNHYNRRVQTFSFLYEYFLRLEWLCARNSIPRVRYLNQIYKFVERSLELVEGERSLWSRFCGCSGFTITFNRHIDVLFCDLTSEEGEWKEESEYEEAMNIVLYLHLYFNQCNVD